MRPHQGGFTLIEIMMVVIIIGLLAAVIAPKIFDSAGKARAAKSKQDIRVLESALDLYKLDNFNYPSTAQGLEALVNAPSGEPPARNWKQGGYIKTLQKDPWGNPYQYLAPGTKGDIDIFTLGADNQPGGEGENADIGNWNLGG